MRRATLADVARQAGVSPSTASRALNGRGELAPATRAAVVAAAEALDFRPSFVARSLRARRTQTLGFVVPDIATPFYATVLRAAQEVADGAGYRLMLMSCSQSAEQEARAVQTLLDHPVDGLLVATIGLTADEYARILGNTVPCVFFDGILEGVGAGTVCVRNGDGMRLLVEHVAGHGHRRIALLAGPQRETSGTERVLGFHAAAEALGLDVPSAYVRECEWTPASGAREVTALLELAEPPTAVVAASDQIALGAVAACRDRGVAIPDDLALVSFDDPPFGALIDPPLTALASQPREIGVRATRLLVAVLRAESPAERDVRLPLELIRRRSCGC